LFFFFFQAEDGIRDYKVTGVQTCALPISGYRYGYGICRSRDEKLPLLTIPRKVLWERSCLNAFGQFSSVIMNCHAYGAFDTKGHCEHDHSPMMQEGMHAKLA